MSRSQKFDAIAKRDQHITLWHEAEKATVGLHAIQMSRGLRDLLGLGQEKTDEEVVEEETGGEMIYEFQDFKEWDALCKIPGGRLRFLNAAERWGGPGVERLARSLFAEYRHRKKEILEQRETDKITDLRSRLKSGKRRCLRLG